MNILIVGATGQLGFTICKKLVQSGKDHVVFATHRTESNIRPLEYLEGINLRKADLTADFCIKAIGNPKAFNRVIPIGGPEALSLHEVKSIFEKAFNKPLKIKSTPPFVINLMSKLLRPFNPPASNILALNYAGAIHDYVVPDAQLVAKEFGVDLISVKDFVDKHKEAG